MDFFSSISESVHRSYYWLFILLGLDYFSCISVFILKLVVMSHCSLFLLELLLTSILYQVALCVLKVWSSLGTLTFSRYEEAKAKGVDSYDRDLEDVIDRLIVECDRKIARALKRLEDEDAKAAIAISVTEVTQVSVSI